MAYPVDSCISRAPRDVESVALLKHTLLWRRPDFEEQPEEKEAAGRAVTDATPRRATVLPVVAGRSYSDEQFPAHWDTTDIFARCHSESSRGSLRRSFYSQPSDEFDDPNEPEQRSGMDAAASDTTAEWPPAKTPSTLSNVAESFFETTPCAGVLDHAAGGAHADCANHSAVAVIRHGERQDSVFCSAWHGTADCQQHPFDCPISDHAVLDARHTARQLRNFADFGVIVASPYLRCVQTAIALADELDLMVLLDNELGEVFGPPVFGDVDPMERFVAGRAWRSRQELYTAVKDWRPKLLQGFSKEPVERVCWKKILGRPPIRGEEMQDAHRRYARRFLTYLSRGRRAQKNMILVSHGIMVQTCLKVLPSTSGRGVASIPYCGGLMANLCQISKQVAGTEMDDDAAHFVADSSSPQNPVPAGDWPERATERTSTGNEHIEQAQLHGWDVQPLGVSFESTDDTPKTRASSAKRYQDLLARLKAGSFSWAQLQLLLGQLPAELPTHAFQPTGTADLSDTATQVSMELFRSPPKFVPLSALEEVKEELQCRSVSESDCKKPSIPQLSLKGSRLMGRRLNQ